MHFRTLLFVAGVCLGILSAYHSGFSSEFGVTALMLCIAELLFFWLTRKRDPTGIALSLCIALFAFGFFVGTVRVQFIPERPVFTCTTACSFDGRVVTSPEQKDTYQLFAVHAVGSPENVYDISVRAPLYPRVRIGETYSFEGKVMIPSPSYPHQGKRSFDYASYLRTKEIGSETMFPRMTLIDPDAHMVRDYLGRWKEEMIERLVAYVASPSSLLASGMLFGDSSLTKEMKESFRVSGLSHIVVLSGFNIAIVISFVLLVFRFLPLIIRISLASIFVIAFVAMVGAEASVVRATLMAFIGLLALALGRQYAARQALIISFLMIVMHDPFSLLHDVSLHLSFLAAAGIIYFGASCSLLLSRYVKQVYVRELFSTTTVAYLVTLPYVAHVFGSVSLYALFANMIVLPIVPGMMLFSFVTVVASFMSHYLAMMSGWIVSVLGWVILSVSDAVASLPYSKLHMSGTYVFLIVILVFGAGKFFLVRNRRTNETKETVSGGYLTDVIAY